MHIFFIEWSLTWGCNDSEVMALYQPEIVVPEGVLIFILITPSWGQDADSGVQEDWLELVVSAVASLRDHHYQTVHLNTGAELDTQLEQK